MRRNDRERGGRDRLVIAGRVGILAAGGDIIGADGRADGREDIPAPLRLHPDGEGEMGRMGPFLLGQRAGQNAARDAFHLFIRHLRH